MPVVLPELRPLARLDDDLGLHRVGDEAFLMRLVMQLGQYLRRGWRVELDRGSEGHARHRHATSGILLEYPLGVVPVAVDRDLARRSEADEPEHVAGRDRCDEHFFRVGAGRVGRAGRDIGFRGVSVQSDRRPEFDAVSAAVLVWIEPLSVPIPFYRCAVDGHGSYILKTPNRVSSIGALSEAEIASASVRRVSSGAMTPSSHSRAVA